MKAHYENSSIIDIKDLETLDSHKEECDLFAKAFFGHAETNLNESLIIGGAK